jgi:hypothetical protein
MSKDKAAKRSAESTAANREQERAAALARACGYAMSRPSTAGQAISMAWIDYR